MSTIPSPDWKKLGSTSNADVFEMRDDIIVIVPNPNCKDTKETALESVAFQRSHWQRVSHRGAVIVYMDNILEQDSGARAVYAEETKDLLTTCYALVGETFFGMVISSVFTGMAQPGLPTRVFPSIAEALPWIEEINRTPIR